MPLLITHCVLFVFIATDNSEKIKLMTIVKKFKVHLIKSRNFLENLRLFIYEFVFYFTRYLKEIHKSSVFKYFFDSFFSQI